MKELSEPTVHVSQVVFFLAKIRAGYLPSPSQAHYRVSQCALSRCLMLIPNRGLYFEIVTYCSVEFYENLKNVTLKCFNIKIVVKSHFMCRI